MKRRLLTFTLALIMVFSLCTPVLVFANDVKDNTNTNVSAIPEAKSDSKIEISLHIGSSVITINDKDITCEPPIIVNGTTMVPLRVISEAFGSTVAWDEATQGITLTYRDVVMKLTINDKNAKINDMTVEMLEAPVIYNDNTMVPLRFISENFGADVTYDDATQKVTVVKELTKSPSVKDYSMILKNTSKEIVGDSYYGWMINMPKNMKMTYRSFNGNSNAFTSDDEEYNVYIDIYKIYDDSNMDTVWANMKKLPSGTTLISQKREDKNGYGYGEMSIKDDDEVVDRRIFFKDKTLTIVDGARKIEKEKENKQNVSDIITSFSYSYNKSNDKVEDLSDVDKDGYRIFKENKYKWSAKIPAEWEYNENVNGENRFYFTAPPKNEDQKVPTTFSLFIFSKEDGLELSKWADRDKAISIDEYNSQSVDISSLIDIPIGKYSAIGYTKKAEDGKYSNISQSAYLYGNSYRYQLNTYSGKDSTDKVLLDNILNSFSFEELDHSVIGDIAEPEAVSADDKAMQTIKNSEQKINFKIPASWVTEDESDGILFHSSTLTNDSFKSFLVTSSSSKTNISQYAKGYIEYCKDNDFTVVNESPVTVAGKQGYYIKFKKEPGQYQGIIRITYMTIYKDKIYILEFSTDQINDGKRTNAIFDAIIKSATFTE